MYIYVYMHINIYTHPTYAQPTKRCTYTYTCVYTCVYIHTNIHTRIHAYIHVYIHTQTYIHILHIYNTQMYVNNTRERERDLDMPIIIFTPLVRRILRFMRRVFLQNRFLHRYSLWRVRVKRHRCHTWYRSYDKCENTFISHV